MFVVQHFVLELPLWGLCSLKCSLLALSCTHCMIFTISLDFFLFETLASEKYELSDHGEATPSEIEQQKGAEGLGLVTVGFGSQDIYSQAACACCGAALQLAQLLMGPCHPK